MLRCLWIIVSHIFSIAAKKGFFGRHMLLATNQKNNLEISGARRSVMMRNRGDPSTQSVVERRLSFSGLLASNNRVNHIVRFIYFLNAAIILVGLGYITSTQKDGNYRCKSISVIFDEEIWEHAQVRVSDEDIEERLLIYSNFNGIYEGKSW